MTIELHDTPDVMRAIAARLAAERADFGLEGASYPPDNYVPASPWAMIRQSLRIPARYEKARYAKQIVHAPIEVVLLVASSEDQPRDAARLDGLISPVLDAFDAAASGRPPIALLPALTETREASLHQLWHEGAVERGLLKWGAQPCHAAIIRLDVVLHRTPKGATP